MHEPAIAAELIDLVERELAQSGHPHAVVTQVRIRLGVMRGVVEDNLRFAWEALKAGTFLESAELVVEKTPVHGACRRCGADFQPQEPLFLCASCGSGDLDIQGGSELDLMELTAAEDHE